MLRRLDLDYFTAENFIFVFNKKYNDMMKKWRCVPTETLKIHIRESRFNMTTWSQEKKKKSRFEPRP